MPQKKKNQKRFFNPFLVMISREAHLFRRSKRILQNNGYVATYNWFDQDSCSLSQPNRTDMKKYMDEVMRLALASFTFFNFTCFLFVSVLSDKECVHSTSSPRTHKK